DHADQCVDVHLAESEEDPRHHAGHRRGEGQGSPDRVPRLAREHDAVDPDAVLHGRGRQPRRSLLIAGSAVRTENKSPLVSGGEFFYIKNGLVVRSVPIVVDGPCPGTTTASSAYTRSLARIDAMMSSSEVPPRSHRPTAPRNRVSPVKSVGP